MYLRNEADFGIALITTGGVSRLTLGSVTPQVALQCPIESDKPRIMIPRVEPSTIRSGFNIGTMIEMLAVIG